MKENENENENENEKTRLIETSVGKKNPRGIFG